MRTLTLGDMRIDVLAETDYCTVDSAWLFPSLTRQDLEAHADWLGPLQVQPEAMQLGFAFQAFVVRAGGRTTLIDTCNGNHKQRPTAKWQHDLRSSAFLDNLAALGLTPADIDFVLCTHLHCDHVGWNTRLSEGRWVPTFPNARYGFSRAEYEHYLALHKTNPTPAVNHGAFQDSVLPIVECGLAEFMDARQIAFETADVRVGLTPSPGHSFGHVCIALQSAGREALVIGDAFHHLIQLAMPDLPMRADSDPARAVQSRREIMRASAEDGAILLAGHVAHKTIMRVEKHGIAFRPIPPI